jgi:hypothetical protein
MISHAIMRLKEQLECPAFFGPVFYETDSRIARGKEHMPEQVVNLLRSD